MDLTLLKVIWSQSGKETAVASFHPPWFPQFRPLRSPLLAPEGSNPTAEEEALATPPLAARARLVGPLLTVTLTVLEVPTLFAASKAFSVRAWLPLAKPVVFH